MSIPNSLRGTLAILSALWFSAGSSLAAPPSRIHEDLANGSIYQLPGNTRPQIASLPDQGAIDEQTPLPRVTLDFAMSDAQQAQLTKLLAEQQNPANSSFHQWLTPTQYADKFGLSKSDLAKVKTWLQNQGFTDIQVAPSRNSISAAATVGLAQNAFRTPIHGFNLNGEARFANTADPYLPAALRGIVQSVRGLSDIHPKPRSLKAAHPHFTSSITGDIYMAPGDFATIYDVSPLYNSGIDGTGEKIAIAGQTDIQTFDIEAFQTAAGLTVKAPTVIVDGTDPGLSKNDLSEAELDIEWAGAVARGATIVYVNSTNAFNSALYAIRNNVANVLSITYGSCEAQLTDSDRTTLNTAFQQAAAQGITVVAVSGDSGAADCDFSSDPKNPVTIAKLGLAVDFPASSPYVTGVGGTEFNEGTGAYWGPSSSNNVNGGSALSYIPEMAWNDTSNAVGLSASGGGVSTVYRKPGWQTGTGVPADGYRDVPDLSLDASPDHDGFLICETPPSSTGVPATASSCVNGFRKTDSSLNVVGGTSVAAPAFAGIVALLNQLQGNAQGNINPRLYTLAATVPDAFHDVTVGNNVVPCAIGTPDCATGTLGYTTTTGYDLVTGLGTIDANNLVQNWGPTFTLSINPSGLTVANASSGTASVTVAAVGGFSSLVSFSCSVPPTLTNTTCSIPGTLTGPGSTTLTISNSAAALTAISKQRWSVPPTTNMFLPLAVLSLLLATALAAFKKRKSFQFAGLPLMAALLMTGCGGSSSSSGSSTVTTPTVTGTVTVTAVSAATTLTPSVTKTITLSVTEP